jgi:hypothetical protein
VIDPDLACAHHFYTQLQVDLGRASEAVVRLAGRLTRRGEDPETLAGLVQVLRCCGLLNAARPAIHLVRRARLGGFWSSCTLERDPAFAGIRNRPEFDDELREARRLERHACQVFRQALGHGFVPQGA